MYIGDRDSQNFQPYEITRAPWPAEVPSDIYGPRIHATVALCCPSARFKPSPSGGQIALPLCRTATIALHIWHPWRSSGLSLWSPSGGQHRVALRIGQPAPLEGAHWRCGPACPSEGAAALRTLREQEPARRGAQGAG